MRASIRPFVLFALTTFIAAGTAVAEPPLEPSYAARGPAIPGLPPGSVLSSASHDAAKGALPPELLERVAAGELEIRIQETTDLPPSEAYVEATRKHAGQAKLAADGSLEGYVAGLPFPVLDTSDPRCGLQAAWNLRHHDFGRGTEAWGTFRSVDGSGRLVRAIEFYYVRAYGMHRWPADDEENRWADDGVLYKEFYQALAPLDVRNVMNLKFRHDDDHAMDVNWAYLPGERRVRKTPAPHEEPTMGTDLLREDYYGFSGYLHAHDWKCLGTGVALGPAGIRAARASLTPSGWPADPWEAREVLVLEAVPRSPSHPYGRRVLYVDRQMFVPLYVLIYDRSGAHEKTLFSLYGNPRFNPGNESVRVPLWVAETMVNHRTGGATITDVERASFDVTVPEDNFTVQQMVSLGR